MCGILGYVSATEPIERRTFRQMLDELSARGPDGWGSQFFEHDRVALGHRRLAIIDLSDAGRQPMANEDRTVWLSCNGEIYNYRSLRRELSHAGHRFSSQCDSEVILHAYEEWGDDCVLRLRGIFAFGIWDAPRQRLLLARDHLGVKPVYYTTDPGRFAFASQPRALVADPSFKRQVDPAALRDYFGFGLVPYDRAIYRNMAKLPAAHRLVLENGNIAVERYWELEYDPVVTDDEEATRLVQDKLTEAVQLQMASDVPIGLFLSGGIDSSILTSLAAKHANTPLRTFTIGFNEAAMDERQYARLVGTHFNTLHHERVLDFDSARQMISHVVDVYDEPYGHGTAFPTLLVSQLAQAEHTKVILGGDGGDEVFAGYLRYDKSQFSWRKELRSVVLRILRGQLPKWRPADPMSAYFQHEGLMNWEVQNSLFAAAPLEEIEHDVLWRYRMFHRPDYPRVTAAQYLDMHTFLPDEVLTKVDRAGMACGVEVRVPLLDIELVETAFRISRDLIYQGAERKALLKQAAAQMLPSEVLTARKKGFSIPLRDWMARAIGPAEKRLVLEGSLVGNGLLDPSGIARLFERKSSRFSWTLLLAELWARRWLDGCRESMDALSTDLLTSTS